MVEVRFINDTTPIEVTSDEQETQIGVVSETQATEIEVGGLVEDKHFVYEQGVASDTWVIKHNLGKYPSVSLVDSAGTQFDADVEYNNENTCTVRMNGATTGKAFLN